MIGPCVLLLFVLSNGELAVGELVVENAEAVATDYLLTLLETGVGAPYDGDTATADERRLEQAYRAQGYLQASVVHRRSLLEESGTLRVNFAVDEGEPTRITACQIEGNRSLPGERVGRILRTLRGEPLDRRLIASARRDIRQLYVKGMHPYAVVHYATTVDTLAREATLEFRVQEGPAPVISSIDVQGTRDVRRGVVLREIRFDPGDVYDGEQLRTSRYRIHELGLFRSVVFDLIGMESAEDSLRLLVRLEEAATRWVEVATGYGSPDRLRLALGVGHDNLGGMARSFFVRGRTSYGWQLDRFVGRVEAGVRDPWIAGLPIQAGLEGFVEERKEMNSRFRKFGGALRLGKRWTERTETSLILSFERRRTLSLAEDASEELRDEAERQVTNSAVASQRFDFRDSPVEPSRGGTVTLTGREAGGLLGGDNHFRMATGELTWFSPLLWEWTGGVRLRIGLARPFGSSSAVPLEERFRAGGAHTVRGYAEEGLGPLDENGEPLGGEQIILTGAEARFPLFGKVWGGAFLDGGQVWARAGDASPRGLNWGAGFGLRYLTFVGPLRLDWALPLPPGKGRVYVALGHAF